MRTLFHFLFSTLTDLPYLMESKLSVAQKTRLLVTYLAVSFHLLVSKRFMTITSMKMFQFTIDFFDFGTFHYLFREIFMRNDYFFHSSSKTPVIFDCGANIGMAIFYFKWLYPDSIIYAFEPDKETFVLLEKNVKQNNLRNVHLYNIALSDKKGIMDFYIDSDNPGWLTMSMYKSRLPKNKIRVEAGKLSDYIRKLSVDLVKMDVEGAEMKIIQELIRSKKLQNIREMIIEYHHNLDGAKDTLPEFLHKIESNSFFYQLHTYGFSYKKGFQDITIYAYKN